MKTPKLPAGLSWYRKHGLYRAQAKVKGKVKHIGYFADPYVGYVEYLLVKRSEINRELTAARKLKAFFVKEVVDARFMQLETRGFAAIHKYINYREGTYDN